MRAQAHTKNLRGGGGAPGEAVYWRAPPLRFWKKCIGVKKNICEG